MNTHIKAAALSLCIAAAIGSMWSSSADAAGQTAVAPITASDMIYTPDEMIGFKVGRYFAKRAPHLRSKSEVISHWAGQSTISPKILIALMEQQSGIVTGKRMSSDAMIRPFGALSRYSGFDRQVQDIAGQLDEIVYSQQEVAASAKAQGVAFTAENPLQLLYQKAGESKASASQLGDREFAQSYAGLFNEALGENPKPSIFSGDFSTMAVPSSTLLRLPYATDLSWYIGGPHGSGGVKPYSSLDMSNSGGWGSSQSSNWVRASAAGTFVKDSSCSGSVVHSGGWSTSYYHLENIQIQDGATVTQGQRIANPANDIDQALCQGGSSTGPHVHWTLRLNGSRNTLDGVRLSGYRITSQGTSNYDDNCSRFYLVKGGLTYCAGRIKNTL